MDFYATEIKKLLISKNVMIVMVPILINTDVFVPSYNDLKFMIQNCNYFFTNKSQIFVLLWLNNIPAYMCVACVCTNCLFHCFYIELYRVLSVVWMSTLIRYILWKYLLPFTRDWLFILLIISLHCAKAFGVMLSHLFILLFLSLLLVSNPLKYC